MILSSNFIRRRGDQTLSRIEESHKNEFLPYRFFFQSTSANHLKHYFCCHNDLFPSTLCNWRYDTYKGYLNLNILIDSELYSEAKNICSIPNNRNRLIRTELSNDDVLELFEMEEKFQNHNDYGVCKLHIIWSK